MASNVNSTIIDAIPILTSLLVLRLGIKVLKAAFPPHALGRVHFPQP